MESLTVLFAHPALPRLLRLFILNPQHAFDPESARKRLALPPATLRGGLKTLEKAGVIKRWGTGKKEYRLDPEFPYLGAFTAILVHPRMLSREWIIKKLSVAGPLKLLVLAGVFVGEETDGVDVLVVTDRLKEKQLDAALRTVEAETGKELKYAAMTTKEFKYRLSMYDRLLRMPLEGNHEKLVNRLGL